MNKILLSICLVCCSVFTQATVRYESYDADVIAKINDFVIPTASAELIFKVTNKHDSSLTKAGLVRGLIENYIFAREAERVFGAQISLEKTNVAFDNQVHLDRDFVKTFLQRYNSEIKSSIKKLPQSSLASLVVQPFSVEASLFYQTTHLQNKLEYKLTDQQIEQAKKLVIMTYQLPGTQVINKVMLWDIYSRQNLQGRIAIHKQNIKFLKNQTFNYLQEKYVYYWARNESGLSASEVDALLEMFKDRFIKDQYLAKTGLHVDFHHENKRKSEKAKEVTQEEILAYYLEHKEEFQIIEKVKARHIRLDSQALADRVYKEINDGLAFEMAVLKYSMSDDKNNKIPGDIGWIYNKDKKSSWLKGISFIQEENVVSKPFRSPQKKGETVYWEIVLVQEKIVGYQAADSEGVRYEASRQIAQVKIIEEFQLTRQRLLDSADIRINKDLLGKHVY